MNSSTISMILLIVLGVFLVWGLIWGIIRGLKNTAFRTAYIVIIAVVAFFVATLITTLLLDLKIGNMIDLSVGGDKAVNLKEYFKLLVQNELQVTADSTSALNTVVGLISIILNSFIFVLLFWLFKWIFQPIYMIIASFTINRKRYKKEKYEKNGKIKVRKIKVKQKRHRILGGLVGVVLGLFVCTFTFVPILGYYNIACKVEEKTADNGKGLVSDMIGQDNYIAVSEGYDKSIFSKVMRYTGMEYVSELLFNSLTTKKIDGVNVNLNKEVDTGIEVYNLVKELKMPSLETCTQEELDTFLVNSRQLINTSFKSGIINSSIDGFMPLIVDYLKQQNFFEDLKPYEETLVVNALNELAEYHSKTIKSELLSVISFVKTVNDYGLLLPVVQNKTGEIIPFLQTTTSNAIVTDILDKMFGMKMIDKVAPDIANLMVDYISTALEVEGEENSEVTSENLKSSLENILINAVELVHRMDTDNVAYVKTEGVSWIGKVIDAIKDASFMTDKMFDSIIEKIQDELHGQVTDVPDWAQDVATEAIDNLSNIDNYTTEFEKVYVVVRNIEDAIKKEDGKNSKDIADMDFEKIGFAIDTLEELVLVNRSEVEEGEPNNLVKKLLIDAIDKYSNEEGLSIDISTFQSITQLKTNISNSSNVVWAQDMPKIKDLLVNVKNILNEEGSISDKLKDETKKNDFVVLGEALDTASTSSLFGTGNVDRLFMIDIMNVVDDSYDSDPNMLSAINNMKTNITSVANITWGVEFENIVELVQMDFNITLGEGSEVAVVGKDIDTILGKSSIIDKNIIDQFIRTTISDNFTDTTYESVKDDIIYHFGDIDADVDNGYDNNIDSYELEFTALNNMYLAYNLATAEAFELKNDGKELGIKIETAINTSIEKNGHTLTTNVVTEEMIDTFINDVIDDKFAAKDSDITTTLNNIKSTFSDIDGNANNGYANKVESYVAEFAALGKLEEVVDLVCQEGFDFYEDVSSTQLANALDNAVASVNVGSVDNPVMVKSSAVTPANINPYIKTKTNFTVDGDYNEIVGNVNSKFVGYLDDMASDSTKTYHECFSEIKELDTIVKDITIGTDTESDWFDPNTGDIDKAVLINLEACVDQIQNNMFGGTQTGRDVMLIILEKFEEVCISKIGSLYTANGKYITAYTTYLESRADNAETEPYIESTLHQVQVSVEVGGSTENVTISVNQPLQFIYDKLYNI